MISFFAPRDAHTMHATEVTDSTRSAALTAIVALLLVIGTLYYMRTYRSAEGMIGNIGGGGARDNAVELVKKPHQCYVDGDCPDGTSCNSDGLCIPRLSDLPVTREESKLGRGREAEKSSF
jgi:hypothetical protein